MEVTDIKMSDNNKSRVSDSPSTVTSSNSVKVSRCIRCISGASLVCKNSNVEFC